MGISTRPCLTLYIMHSLPSSLRCLRSHQPSRFSMSLSLPNEFVQKAANITFLFIRVSWNMYLSYVMWTYIVLWQYICNCHFSFRFDYLLIWASCIMHPLRSNYGLMHEIIVYVCYNKHISNNRDIMNFKEASLYRCSIRRTHSSRFQLYVEHTSCKLSRG